MKHTDMWKLCNRNYIVLLRELNYYSKLNFRLIQSAVFQWRSIQLCLKGSPFSREASISAASFTDNPSSLDQYAVEGEGSFVLQVFTKFRRALYVCPHHTLPSFAGRTMSNKRSYFACCSIISHQENEHNKEAFVLFSFFLFSFFSPFISIINPKLNHTNYFIVKYSIKVKN